MTAPTHPKARNPDAPWPSTRRAAERALLVHLRLSGTALEAQEDVEELRLLATSAGAEVIGTVVGRRHTPDAGTFVGKGKAEEVRDLAARERADVVLVNHALSPSQERNLEKVVGCRVLDRVALILDIFAQRARSHEGKLQVELAQLEHLSTRLVRGWTHLERQKGGIGLRGPGETQLEVDRRLIRDRIKKLNDRLAQVSTQRRSRRRARHKVPIPTVSLVGYTNAGKSTLFNQLTGAGVFAADQLFATLDPTMRRVELPGNNAVVLADTVGFIRHLPHDLVEAFKSTLEEVADADLLLHVVDSHHGESLEQMAQVNAVLADIGAAGIAQAIVFNKIDLSGEPARVEYGDGKVFARVWLSARSGEGVELLRELLAQHYRAYRRVVHLELPADMGRLRAQIYERAEILSETPLQSGGWMMDAAVTPAQLAWLQQQKDYRPEFLRDEALARLAATGS
ncbi:MAG: GTPase HflX [Pseudomonadota bacterium]|nr:MAG: GTPase HflX [Pseudomonadota bacterium]